MDIKTINALTAEQLTRCPPIAPTPTLQQPELRFVKVLMWDKPAFEQGWTKTTQYAYDDPVLLAWLADGGNYGIATGRGNLLVFDVDDTRRMEELGILQILTKEYPTYKVRTRSGGLHLYYYCPGFDKKRVMYDLTLTEKELVDDKKGGQKEITTYKHLGELQWLGQQCVAPTSRFRTIEEPDKVIIQLWREEEPVLPIATITPDVLLGILSGKVRFSKKLEDPVGTDEAPGKKREKANDEKRPYIKTSTSWKDNIPVAEIGMPTPIEKDHRNGDGEIVGAHPLHGSNSGHNYSINVKKNCWYCFRDNSGGGPLELIAVMHGIIQCGEAGPGCLDKEGRMEKVLAIARELGFVVPDNAFIMAKTAGERRKGLIRYIYEVIAGTLNFVVLNDDSILLYDEMRGCYDYDQGHPEKGEHTLMALIQDIGGDSVDIKICAEVLARIRRRTRYKITDFDSLEGLISVKNGILNMKTGELREHTPTFLTLHTAPFDWDPDADTSVATGFLTWYLPDEETRGYLISDLGCTIAGVKGRQKLSVHFGEKGGNGKSVLVLVTQAFLGPLAWSMSAKIFQENFNGNFAFSAAEIEGRKWVTASEPEERAVYLSEQVIKMLTGENVPARNPYGRRERNVRHEGSSYLGTNLTVRFRGGINYPISRRLDLYKCEAEIKEVISDYDKVLLETGGAGFLRLYVGGYRRYLEGKMQRSPLMEEWLRELINENDPLMGFVDEAIEIDPGHTKAPTFEDLNTAYKIFVSRSGYGEPDERTRNKTWLGRELQKQLRNKKIKFNVKRNPDHTALYYYGIKLKDQYNLAVLLEMEKHDQRAFCQA